jgi:phosphoribosyl-ATP pyrophosphohydrolase/phosphoribosyl-AMP cyclohydrolase
VEQPGSIKVPLEPNGEVRQKMSGVEHEGSSYPALAASIAELTAKADWAKAVEVGSEAVLPAIVQCAASGRVLMLGYVSKDSLKETARLGEAVFYSRSRQELWHKGATSGHHLRVEGVALDCDGDTFLLLCRAQGPACHRGTTTCFDGPTQPPSDTATPALFAVLHDVASRIDARAQGSDPNSYSYKLLHSGRERVLRKVGEEATELVIAGMSGDAKAFTTEAADLVFHLLLAAHDAGVTTEAILSELAARQGQTRRDGTKPL